MLHQLIEDAHTGAVPNDMGMHGEQKQPPFHIGSIKLPAPDFAHE